MEQLKVDKNTKFQNGRHESLALEDILDIIIDFVNLDPKYQYKLSIGTDSMTYRSTQFVLAIVLHKVGNGGIYFYKKFTQPPVKDLRTKLYTETQLSINTTDLIVSMLLDKDEHILEKLNLSIHLDIGTSGPSKDLIRELEGWVAAMGYDYAIKPDSYAASTIANIYSK